jgi:pyridoxal phosphate-dependent aminotransferase EpsN
LSPPQMGEIELKYMVDAFNSNWIAPLGPQVDSFEEEVKRLVGATAGLATISGTAAIHLALRLLGIKEGDIVFCSSLTFVATANPILYEKAIPVFIDSDYETWNMSYRALKRAFDDAENSGQLPKAVIVVNLYGQSADLEPIIRLCRQYGVPVIEDAAESLGATYKNRMSGSIGDFGIYSFNGNKIITTSGGGMLVSSDELAITEARFLATQAKDPAPYYQHSQLGYNYRMSNILAAIGRGQLEALPDKVAAKRRIFEYYRDHMGNIPGIHFMPEASYGQCTRWLTVITINPAETTVNCTDLINNLAEHNIEARRVWKPLHLQPLFEGNNYYEDEIGFSVCTELFNTGVCLPSGASLSDEDLEWIVQCIKNIMS